MKGYERATKEEINDRLRIEENCHAQVERIIYIRHLCNLNLEEAADVTNLSISTLKRSDQMQRTEPHNDILPLSEIPLRAAYPLRQEPVSHRYELVSQLKSDREIKRTHKE